MEEPKLTLQILSSVAGAKGDSIYDIAVRNGYTGTEEEFIDAYMRSVVGNVYDISANHLVGGQPSEYANLAAALGIDGANIPSDLQLGGMSVKFIESTGHTYVQYRLMKNQFSTNESDWQGIDNGPTAGSDNLVKSGGVAGYVNVSQNTQTGEKIVSVGSDNNVFPCYAKKIFNENSERDNGYYRAVNKDRVSKTELFNQFIPCDARFYYSVSVQGIGSNSYPSIIFIDKNASVIKYYYNSTLKRKEYTIPEGTIYCYINYYTDAAAIANNIDLYSGVFLYEKDNAKDFNFIQYLTNKTHELDGGTYVSLDTYCGGVIPVQEGEKYKIKGYGGNSARTYFITDESNNILSVAPYQGGTELNDVIAIPKGGKNLIVNFRPANDSYQFDIEKLESISNYNIFSNEVFTSFGKRLSTDGITLVNDSSAMVSDYIPVRNVSDLFITQWLSSVHPFIFFYNKAKCLIKKVNADDGAYHRYKHITVPKETRFIRVNYTINDVAPFSLYFNGEINFQCGKRCNPFAFVTEQESIRVINENSLSGFPISMAPTMWGDDNSIFIVCDKRAAQADTGISHIFFVKYDIVSGQNLISKIVFESGDTIGRYHNGVVFKDVQGILGTANRLYVFALKVNAAYIDTYISSITDKDQADFVYKYSDDDGDNWSSEISLKEYFPDNVVVFGTSPSQPVILTNGTLCLPGYVVKNPGGNNNCFRCGYITYNGGWHLVMIDKEGSETDNECSVAEYGTNAIIVNTRNFYGVRAIYNTSQIDNNNSEIIYKHPSTGSFLSLTDYGCQGCIIKYGSYYLFLHIDISDNSVRRENLCVWISYDCCKFYPLVYININNLIGGYGNLCVVNDKLYCVYESASNRVDIRLVDITEDINNALQNNKDVIFNIGDEQDLLIASFRQSL